MYVHTCKVLAAQLIKLPRSDDMTHQGLQEHFVRFICEMSPDLSWYWPFNTYETRNTPQWRSKGS